jgi:hypothetical protein
LESTPVRAKKTDIAVRAVALAWVPEWAGADGARVPAWRS